MASKQEKLAAARKKLKEFQGKSKEAESLKVKRNSRDFSRGSNCFTGLSELQEVGNVDKQPNHFYSNQTTPLESNNETLDETIRNIRDISSSLPIQSNQQLFFNETQQKHSNSNVEMLNKSDMPLFTKDNENEVIKALPTTHESFTELSQESQIKSDLILTGEGKNIGEPRIESNNFCSQTNNALAENGSPNFTAQLDNKESLNKIVQPLQDELKNYAQTINVLVYQRNEIQNCLVQNQSLLKEKTEEIEKLKKHLLNSDSTVHDLNKKISESEHLVKQITFEKEKLLKSNSESVALVDLLKAKLESREEEFFELQKKFEEKSKECEQSLINLQKAQSQLSLYQIQLQQFSSTDSSSLAVKVSELQNENLNLSQKIKELEKRLEVSSEENEQSSQKFHAYAQQCDSQLNCLTSEVEALKLENEKLRKDNEILASDLSELENLKKEKPAQQDIEIGNLHSEIHSLIEANNNLRNYLNEKDQKLMQISDDAKEKQLALENMEKVVEEVKVENKKLIMEAKNPEANERLLAAMESDKVAAAKAVSQNQKLKNQIVELEKAFLKMSEEKLKLTDELAHERHVNAELQKALNSTENISQADDHSKCQHNHNREPLVNDSNEIEELRTIIRQLQDDKVELKARLSSFEPSKSENSSSCKHEEENQVQCENTNLLLQQMEEKVRKTMNEIAVLDEEKEKLEHLVLQLQGETETIGEYITLYQKQRMLLRQRAQEKDKELLQLSKDKEELRSKLATLDELVQHLVGKTQSLGLTPELLSDSLDKKSEAMAEKIRELINEIGSTSLVKNHTVAFEHCSCCSGRLITL